MRAPATRASPAGGSRRLRIIEHVSSPDPACGPPGQHSLLCGRHPAPGLDSRQLPHDLGHLDQVYRAGRAVTVIIEDSQLRILHDGNPLAAHLFTPGGLRHVRES